MFMVSIKGAEVASVGRGFPMLHRRDCLRLFGLFLSYVNVKIWLGKGNIINLRKIISEDLSRRRKAH